MSQSEGSGSKSEEEIRSIKFKSTTEELIESERYYVRDLGVLINIFKEPVNELGLLSAEDFEDIFLNTEQIYRVHSKLLRYLEAYDSSSFISIPIGKSFLGAIGNLVLPYKEFCTNHQKSVETFRRVREANESFAEFLEDAKRIEETDHLDLESFLIKPVQRICKYPLLFQQLLKYCPRNNPDEKDLQVSLHQIQRVNEYVNEDLKVKMDLDEVKRMETLMDGLSEPISNGSRILIHYDSLIRVKNKKTDERSVFVFNDMCLMGKTNGKRYKIKYRVNLKDLIIMKDEDGFTLNFQHAKKENHMLKYRWRDESEKKEWSEIFEKAMGTNADDGKRDRKWFTKYRDSASYKEKTSTVFRYSYQGENSSNTEAMEKEQPLLNSIFQSSSLDEGEVNRAASEELFNSDEYLKTMENLQLARAPPRLKKLISNLQKENERLHAKLRREVDGNLKKRERMKKLLDAIRREKNRIEELERSGELTRR